MKNSKRGCGRLLMIAATLVLVTVMALLVSITVTATHHYYGENLSPTELRSRYERGEVLHCVQAFSILGIANGFECFDTLAEVASFTAARS